MTTGKKISHKQIVLVAHADYFRARRNKEKIDLYAAQLCDYSSKTSDNSVIITLTICLMN